MCRIRMLIDQPITMRERESGLNSMDAHYLFEKNASEAEVLSMHINGAEPYRKKKAITKIFRRSSYIPKLEDIEENPEFDDCANSAKVHDLSLAFIHLQRAIGAGVMAQESRRRKRKNSSRFESKGNESPRRERRNRHRVSAEKE